MSFGNPKPSQLAWLTIAGGLTQGSIFLLPGFRHHHALWLSAGAALVLLAGGATIMLKSVSALKNGVQNQHWPPEEIDPLRSICESPWFVTLIVVLFVAWGVLFLAFGHGIQRSIGWSFYMPAQALAQLSSAFRLKASQDRKPIDWHNVAPLKSEHWGER